MKILLVSPYYSPGVGGSSRLLQDVMDYLHAHGHQVEVLTYGLEPDRKFLEFDRKQPYPIHRILPQRLPGGSSLAMFVRLVQLSYSRHYDVILSGVAFPSAILAFVVSRITRIPYVVYSMSEDVTCVEGSQRKRKLLARALNAAQNNMVISRFTQQQVEALGVGRERIQLVPPGIDAAPYFDVSDNAVEGLRQRFQLQGKRTI